MTRLPSSIVERTRPQNQREIIGESETPARNENGEAPVSPLPRTKPTSRGANARPRGRLLSLYHMAGTGTPPLGTFPAFASLDIDYFEPNW